MSRQRGLPSRSKLAILCNPCPTCIQSQRRNPPSARGNLSAPLPVLDRDPLARVRACARARRCHMGRHYYYYYYYRREVLLQLLQLLQITTAYIIQKSYISLCSSYENRFLCNSSFFVYMYMTVTTTTRAREEAKGVWCHQGRSADQALKPSQASWRVMARRPLVVVDLTTALHDDGRRHCLTHQNAPIPKFCSSQPWCRQGTFPWPSRAVSNQSTSMDIAKSGDG